MYFRRLDTTHFYGYNSGSIYLSYQDTIYNFGGWGFWKANGHLRYYSEFNREWNMKTLDKEIPLIPIFYLLNPKKGYLYYSGDDKNVAVTNSKSTFPVARLDLKNQKNILLGSLNPIIVNEFSKTLSTPITVPAPSLNGIIVIFNYNNQYLLDFEENKLLRLTNMGLRDYFLGNSRSLIANNCFIEDSTLYFTFARDTTFQLYHTKITRKDFEEKGEPLYIKPVNGYLIGGLSLLAAFFLSGFIFVKYKKKSVKTKHGYFPGMSFDQEDATDPLHFIDEELTLIKAIHESTLQKRYFAVDDINTHMGIKRKTLEVQKKIRTEIISRINHKFRVHSEGENDLIERVRSEQDRRYFKYMIRTENMGQLKAIIQQQGGRP
jgi:hypothetical protein